jgi:hypothetical protein
MNYYISEGEAQYMDMNRGHFSKALAQWAISRMRARNADGELVKINSIPLDEVENILDSNGVVIKEECVYDAWYLYNMCLADYRKTMPEKKDIVNYINETINDPDCKPEAVLACWRAKMDVMRVPIHWERYL